MGTAVPQCPLTPIASWFSVLVVVGKCSQSSRAFSFFFFYWEVRKILWNSWSLLDWSRHNCSISVTLLRKLSRAMEVDYCLLLAEAQLCRSCLCLFQQGHDLPHATWKSFERFPMARTTLQLCNEVFFVRSMWKQELWTCRQSRAEIFPYSHSRRFFWKV